LVSLSEHSSIVYDDADAAIFDSCYELVYLFSGECPFFFSPALVPHERSGAKADQWVEGFEPVPSEDEVVSHDIRAPKALGSLAVCAGHVSHGEFKVMRSVELQALVIQVFRDWPGDIKSFQVQVSYHLLADEIQLRSVVD
jgi:hypothetical protein